MKLYNVSFVLSEADSNTLIKHVFSNRNVSLNICQIQKYLNCLLSQASHYKPEQVFNLLLENAIDSDKAIRFFKNKFKNIINSDFDFVRIL